jgi:hypothetical protein
MNIHCRSALHRAGRIFLVLLVTGSIGGAAERPQKQARVTRIIRDVKLLPSQSAPKPAVLDDKVNEGTGVRTGNSSLSELTFVDLTITRLGANTIFSFNTVGRNVELDSGSMLLRVPKDSGGAHMSTSAVTVAISGTTVILESRRPGRNKLTVLEGGARLSLKKNPRESANVRGGQMIDVPAGATKLPPVVNVDLDQIMKTNPLITNFRPLPSQDLIYAAQTDQAQPVGGQPAATGPAIPPVLGNLTGIGLPNIGSSRTRTGGSRHTDTGHTTRHGSEGTKTSGSKTIGTHDAETNTSSTSSAGTDRTKTGTVGSNMAKPKPSPTPSRRRKQGSG